MNPFRNRRQNVLFSNVVAVAHFYLSYQCPYVESDISDDDLIMMMPEWLFDDVRATEHVIGLLYQAAWVCAELREHLKQYEDKEDADGKTDEGEKA